MNSVYDLRVSGKPKIHFIMQDAAAAAENKGLFFWGGNSVVKKVNVVNVEKCVCVRVCVCVIKKMERYDEKRGQCSVGLCHSQTQTHTHTHKKNRGILHVQFFGGFFSFSLFCFQFITSHNILHQCHNVLFNSPPYTIQSIINIRKLLFISSKK